MTICPHCKGTGEAPIKLKQECISCQKQIVVTFETVGELAKHDGRAYCTNCKAMRNAPTR